MSKLPIEPGVAKSRQEVAQDLPPELTRQSRYEVGPVVARGGMGAILDAREVAIERNVAMKVMLSGATRTNTLRFIEEAKITGQLEHPNIVPVHELGVDENGRIFFTMKFVKGLTLKKALESVKSGDDEDAAKYDLAALLTAFQKVCDAIAFAHARGVIHRDLKPENIMLGDYGEVLVMDWGLAKVLGSAESGGESRRVAPMTPQANQVQSVVRNEQGLQTLAGTIMGTPHYMSPEQAMGEIDSLTPRTDIYALGAILYEILTLRPPVSGKTLQMVLSHVVTGKIDPPHNKKDTLPHLPDNKIPDSLVAVARKAMSVDPALRYARVEYLQKEITAFQSGYATTAENAGALKQAKLFVKRNRAVSIAVGTAALVIITLTTAFVLSVIHQRNIAVGERARAQDALSKLTIAEAATKKSSEEALKTLAELRRSAPAFYANARSLFKEIKFDEAIEKIGYAINLDPENAEYHLFMANALQATLRLKDAAAEYRKVLELRANDVAARANLDLCEILLAESGPAAVPGKEQKLKLFNKMIEQGRALDAIPLSRELNLSNQTAQLEIENRIKPFMAQPKWVDSAVSRIRKLPDGTYDVKLHGLNLPNLEFLSGLPISQLDVSDCGVTDFAPLRQLKLTTLTMKNHPAGTDISGLKGLKLKSLSLAGCKLKDMSAISGMPLEYLDLTNCNCPELPVMTGMPLKTLWMPGTQFANITPLAGLPLELLYMHNTPQYTSIEPLKGMKLKELTLEATSISDLSVLRGMPLKCVTLNNCRKLTDLTPLADCPTLEQITLPTHISDVEFLRKLTGLKKITNRSFETYKEWYKVPNAADFWKSNGERLLRQVPMEKKLAEFRQYLIDQGNEAVLLPNFSFGSNGELVINLRDRKFGNIDLLKGVAVTDFTMEFGNFTDIKALTGAPLERINIANTLVEDLTPLHGAPLKHVRISNTRVSDLSPLIGTPLTTIIMDKASALRDVSALAEIPTLEMIILPEYPKNVIELKKLPNLKRISYQPDGLIPSLTSSAFWGRYGAQLERQAPMEKQLGKFRQRLMLEGNDPDKIPKFAFNQDGVVGISIDGFKCSDVSELRGVDISSFNNSNNGRLKDISALAGSKLTNLRIVATNVEDISALANTPLQYFHLYSTKVKDISAVRKMPLKHLYFHGTQVKDVSVLGEITTLERVSLPAGAQGVLALRKLPNLQYISYKYDSKADRAAQTAEEFWKEYDLAHP